MGLDPMPVTSGSKGIHLYAALDGTQSSDEVSAVAKELARSLEADHPDLVVSDMKKALRGGKVLLDWSQNNGSKTTIVPYSLRGRVRPMVAAPRTWRELGSPSLRQLEFHEVLATLAKKGDPLAELSASHPPRN
jgi:bifunctional non-homologous end joining protein LigD